MIPEISPQVVPPFLLANFYILLLFRARWKTNLSISFHQTPVPNDLPVAVFKSTANDESVFLLYLLQYVYLKQMTKAAVVIQNQFRSYYEHKRFKKNMESPSTSSNSSSSVGLASAAVAAAYRNYRETSITASSARQSREGTPTSSALK